jgi:hypothetical protein
MVVISREQAREQGLTFYYTGKVCKRGHDSVRLVSKGNCRECHKEDGLAYYQDNPEKVEARVKSYYDRNKDSYLERQRKWQKENPEKVAEQQRRYKERYPEKAAANSLLRRAVKRRAMLPDRTLEDRVKELAAVIFAKSLTETTGIPHHCDHIIALNGVMPDGSKVFGPHVWWNLRPLSASENSRKCNRVTEAEIQQVLDNLRQAAAPGEYVEAVNFELRRGKSPADWILPLWSK